MSDVNDLNLKDVPSDEMTLEQARQAVRDLRMIISEIYSDITATRPNVEIYNIMTAQEFEEWLRKQGICNPDINGDIPCKIVPLLLDDAVSDFLSKQPEKKRKVNLNERIAVKLTDFGKEVCFHRYDQLYKLTQKEVFKQKYPKVDSRGYTTFQLLEFINTFGRFMEIGTPEVIQPLDIICLGK